MSMTSTPSPAMERAHEGYVHDVMLWSGQRAFVTAAADFVRQGVLRGELALVALPAARLRAVRAALGEAAEQVRFAEMESLGSNPACIIQAWVDFVAAAGDRPSRGVGEPLWPGRTGVEVTECQLHEALLNDAIPAAAPLWLRCPYEVDALPDEVVEQALHAHPWVTESDGTAHPNDAYLGDDLGATAFASPLPPAPAATIVRTITPETIRVVRDLVLHVARVCGIPDDRAADLGLALHELGVNSVLHGRGSGTLRLWRTSQALVCEVADDGLVADPLAGRLAPGTEEPDGRGLWMVNQLCDLVQLRSSGEGTTVRVHTWL
ncbi:sensor histidine kinase [Pedococcus bigeumensis]|uniref:sensor histidine kinase n=1 Tax=Pedococcus bigeumensis TaxID=433644 RepID=UPI002FEB5873